MNKKKRIIILIVFVFLLTMSLIPVFLKQKAIRLLVQETEKNTPYQVKYEKIRLSFFRHFPAIEVHAENCLLDLPSYTFLEVEELSGVLSLGKLMRSEPELKAVVLKNPRLRYAEQEKAEVAENQTKKDDETAQNGISTTFFPIASLTVENGAIFYQNADSATVRLSGLNFQMNGDQTAKEALLKAKLSVDSTSYAAKGFSLKNVPIDVEAEMVYIFEEQSLEFKENHFQVGKIHSSLEGGIAFDEETDFDVRFETKDVPIKEILKMFSTSFMRDAEHLEADGNALINGYVKGKYVEKDLLPAFGADLRLTEAWFQYANLPEKVEHINISAKITHPHGTNADHTSIAVENLEMRSGDNFLQGQLKLSTPVSDISVDGDFQGNVDLASLRQALPMAASTIVGKMNADLTFNGKLSDIEQENYQDFHASGHLTLEDYFLKNKNIPQGVDIAKATLRFTPERVNIESFNGKAGTSDLLLSGYLSNYFAWFFDDKPLKGELALRSRFLNLNEFSAHEKSTASPTVNRSDSVKQRTAFVVPRHLHLVFNSEVSQVKVDDVFLQNFKGKLTLQDSKALLENLNFSMLGGKVNLNGQYNSQQPQAIFSDLSLKVSDIDVEKATQSLSVLRKALPISQTTQGRISSEMNYYAKLDEQGEVDMQSIKSEGYISSPGLRIANNASLNKLAHQMNDVRYRDITSSAVWIDYHMADGKITLSPFDVKLVDKNIKASGWYSLENQLDFTIKTSVKAKEIGGDVSKYIGMVSDVNKPLPVTIQLTGDAKNPDIGYDTREAIKILRDDVSKNLNKDAINSILKNFF